MRKVILTLGIALCTIVAHAQTIDALKSAAKATATNTVKASATDIVSALSTKLGGLTNTQKTNATTAVGGFLKEKESFTSLSKAAATAKLAGSKKNLLSKLKTILTVKQYASLLGLKSSAKNNSTDAALNLLSQIL